MILDPVIHAPGEYVGALRAGARDGGMLPGLDVSLKWRTLLRLDHMYVGQVAPSPVDPTGDRTVLQDVAATGLATARRLRSRPGRS